MIDDVEWYSFVDNGITKYQFRMKAYNGEDVPGMIRISYQPSRKSGRVPRSVVSAEFFRTFLFEPGEAQEIGVVTAEKPKEVLVNTLISHNLPPVKKYNTRKLSQREDVRPFDGSKPIDPSRFAVQGNCHIVDNTDPGFEVVSDPAQSWLTGMLKRIRKRDTGSGYARYVRNKPPHTWKEAVHERFYGPYIQSAHYIAAGRGEGRVRWTADIPESGTYEVYCFMPDCMDDIPKPEIRKKIVIQEYHLSVEHDEGTDHPVIPVVECRNGWNLVGTYYFSKGKVKVELTDESPGRSIVADAIKWVKKD